MPDIFVAPPKRKKAAPKKETVLEKQSDREFMRLPILEIPVKKMNSVHLFSSYCENPEDIIFKNQEKDEKVLLFVRKHFVTNALWITAGAFLLILPPIVASINAIINFSVPFFSAIYILFFTLFYYLFVTSYLFIRFITWYFNVSLVTSERIIDIDFSDVIYKNLAATKLGLVQDVSYTQTGVIRTFFQYGDVLVQTAGETINFDFEAVPQPENVVHIIGGLIGKNGNI